jgi:hypothetical protein
MTRKKRRAAHLEEVVVALEP